MTWPDNPRIRPELAQFRRFIIVGATGFCIDAGVLAALLHITGVDPLSGRVVSITAAALATWRLNRLLTFGASAASQMTEALRYACVAAASAGLNYAVYALALFLAPELPPVGAVGIATMLATAFSYFGYSRYVYGGAPAAVFASSPRSQSR